jgi:RNA polymerase sigma-B factor
MTGQTRHDTTSDLWSAYAAHPDSRLREQLIERHRNLAMAVLKGLGRRWDEDLEQVAMLGLVKAVDRFNPATGHSFSSFAVPTILGEVRRYLRDCSRMVRPPRSLIDLNVAARVKELEMIQTNRRVPTLAELATAMGVDLDHTVEAMAMEDTCRPRSLDGLVEAVEREHPTALEERLGEEDRELEKVETQTACRQALAHLDASLQDVIRLRYYDNLTQAETARSLGVSQMQISRLERRALAQMRGELLAA